MQVYTIYSILFIVFLILLIVTAFITIALTYFQLAVEDHRWWWRSFLCGGSTGERLLAPHHVEESVFNYDVIDRRLLKHSKESAG